jgi:hypothetical protein
LVDHRRRLATTQVSYEFPLVNQPVALSLDAFVVITETTKTSRHGSVGNDVDDFRAVFQLVQLVNRHERATGQRYFGTENTIQLGRVAARFMHLQSHLRSVDDNRRGCVGTWCCGQQGYCFLANALGMVREIHPLYVLITAGREIAAERVRI